MSSQACFRRLMFTSDMVGNDGYEAMHRLLPSIPLRKVFRDQILNLGQHNRANPVVLGSYQEYQWLAASLGAPHRTVLLVERTDGTRMGVKEGLRVERAALARVSGLSAMIIHVRPYDMTPGPAMTTLRENLRDRRRWSVGLQR